MAYAVINMHVTSCPRVSFPPTAGGILALAVSCFFFFLDQRGSSPGKKKPFFELDVQLSVPSVRLSPSLEDVQRSVNAAAASVLG